MLAASSICGYNRLRVDLYFLEAGKASKHMHISVKTMFREVMESFNVDRKKITCELRAVNAALRTPL